METRMPEDPKDTDASFEGLKFNAENHRTRTEEARENWSQTKKWENTDKVSITSTFNTLNPLN